MKKKWLLLVFWTIVACFSLQAYEHPSQVELFKGVAQAHVLEPSLTIPLFLRINIQEFTEAWSFFVKIMTQESHRLFSESKQKHSEHSSRALLISHCYIYNTLLTHFFVSPEGALLYTLDRPIPAGYVSVFDYAKKHSLTSIHDFYAFYFDCLSADYKEMINNAALSVDDEEEYSKYQNKSQTLYLEMYTMYEHLYGSEYEACYGAHLKTYQDIFKILVDEKHVADAL